MRTCLLLSIILASATYAPGKDHVLTIGGGFSPAGNQVSLERNVLFFEKLLAERFPEGTSHDLYFSDGASQDPDLQFQVEGDDVPRANRLMAGLFGTEEDLANRYRNNALAGVRGVSSPEEVERWFQEVGSQLAADDRLILYVTAHGGPSRQKENKFNTRIWMWNRQSIDAAALERLIGGLPEGVRVVTVMVQCFSGGFSQLIFEANNADKEFNGRTICGFYATVFNREAAGCTPDVNEANYDEFSSHFWAALRGKTRLGLPVDGCDYDGDGRVSFEEAHAYAVLVSRNIDIPVKTSGAYLRARSELAPEKGSEQELLGVSSDYSEVLAQARPVERVVLEGLSEQLGLAGEDRGARVKAITDDLEEEMKALAERTKAQKKRLDGVKTTLARDIRNTYPVLENKHSPGAVRLLSEADQSAAFVGAVESHPRFEEWDKLRRERSALEEEKLALWKKYASYGRFLRAFENVAYTVNLRKVGSTEAQERFTRLVEAEQEGLGDRSEKRDAAESK